jgi:L-asparaginase
MKIVIITTGGTIDKIYFDQLSTYQVGEPQIARVLAGVNVGVRYEVVPLLRKDSLDLTVADRQLILSTIRRRRCRRILITHGTDTMIETGRALRVLEDRTIVLTGALQPAGFSASDAVFNIGAAFTAVQLLPPGVWVVMNGRVFDPLHARKNRARNRFEAV